MIKAGLAAGNTTNQYQTEVTDDNVQTTTPQLITYRYEDGEGDPLVLLDGSAAGVSTANTPSGTVSNMSRLVLGRGAFDGSSSWNGDIAEVILFGTGLNEAERKLVHTYLAEKYDKWNGGGEVLTYNYTSSHFGDFAGLIQEGSGREHLDAQSGELRLQDNDGNLSSGNVVLFGHDEEPFSLTTDERPRGDDNVQKTEREWRVDLEGSNTNPKLDVTVDISSLSLSGDLNAYGLFVDTDGDGDFTTGTPDFYPLDSSGEATDVTIEDGDYVTVAALSRTVAFETDSESDFENGGGDNLGDAFAPSITATLNYPAPNDVDASFKVAEATGTLVEDETTVGGRDHPDYRRVQTGTFTFGAGTTGPVNFNQAGQINGENSPALEIVNDGRDAQSDDDESSAEDLDVTLTSDADVEPGSPSTFTFTINDDDDPRKISFTEKGSEKPVKTLDDDTNPEEDCDENNCDLTNDDLSDEEDAVDTVTFEVALPEGTEGSDATFAVFEISGADTDDFSIPADGDNEKVSDRRGKVQVNETVDVNGNDTGYGTFDVTIEDDPTFEEDETITVELVSAESGTLDPDDKAILDFEYEILNDDPKPEVFFSSDTDSGEEDVSPAEGTLELSAAAEVDLDVAFTVAGTATGSGDDYTQDTSSPVTFSAGTTTRDVSFLIEDDDEQEADETIKVEIDDGSSTDPPVGAPSTFTYTIVDNDRLGSTGPAGVGSAESTLLWLRADAIDGVSDGDALSAWADQSGNNHDLTAATAPTFNDGASGNAINGLPVVTFGGNGEFLEDDGNGNYLDGLDGLSIFSVVQSVTTGTDAGYFDTEGSANGRDELLAVRYDDAGANSGRDNVIKIGINDEAQQLETSETIDGVSVQQTAPQIHQVRWASGTDLTFALNGTNDGSPDLSGSTVDAPLQANTVELGRGPKANGDANGWDGQVAEVAVFSTALNVTQRTIVQNYLSAKYDVALTSGTADQYAGDDNGNGDYDFGVFGIGKETDSDFHPAAETDGLRFEAAAGGLSDGDYLLAGYAESNNSANTSDLGGVSGLEARMERDWYWEATNSGSGPIVDVTFDLAEAGLESALDPEASGYVLLFRSGQTGDWTAVSSDASVANLDEITFTDIDAGDEGYYTLGTTDRNASPLEAGKQARIVEGTAGADGTDEGWRYLGFPGRSGASTPPQAQDLQRADGSQFIDFSFNMAYRNDGEPADCSSNCETLNSLEFDGSGFATLSKSEELALGRGFIVWIFDNERYPVDPSIGLKTPAGFDAVGASDVTVGDESPNATADPSLSTSDELFLLANPYAVPFDLGSLYNASSGGPGSDDFDTVVQIWEPDADKNGNDPAGHDDANVGSFVTKDRSAGDDIAPWQGFLLTRTNSTETQITFNSGGRLTSSSGVPFVGSKSSSGTKGPARHVDLEVVGSDGGTVVSLDKAASVLFREEASRGRDAYDAPKIAPMGDGAVLSPVATGADTSLRAQESRPLPTDTASVPLFFQAGAEARTYTLTAPEWENVPSDWTVELVDTKGTAAPGDDQVHALESGGEGYTFESKPSKATVAKTGNARTAKTESAGSSGAPRPRFRRLRWDPIPADTTGAPSTAKSDNSEDDVPLTRFRLRVVPPAGASGGGGSGLAELSQFEVKVAQEGGTLNWQTRSEADLEGFVVQHQRLGGVNDTTVAPSKWTKLGFVEGRGSRSKSSHYQHEIGELNVGRHAFRLRKIGKNGSGEPTEAKQVAVELEEAYALTPPYPNPVKGQAHLDLTVQQKQQVTIQIYDVLGRQVATPHRETLEASDPRQFELSTRRLSSGAYFVRIDGEHFTTTTRMTVVR